MPESTPAPNRWISWSGQPARTWFQRSDLALRGRLPELLELGDRHRRRPGVLRVDDDRQAVVGDRQLDELHAGLRAGLALGRADRPRRVGDVDLVAAELLEAAAGAGDADGDARFPVALLKLFGDRFGDWIDRARPVDLDDRGRPAAEPDLPAAQLCPPPQAPSRSESGSTIDGT